MSDCRFYPAKPTGVSSGERYQGFIAINKRFQKGRNVRKGVLAYKEGPRHRLPQIII